MIKDENYINIQGFMITKLGLTGNDLLVYAIIYGFSQDGESVFKGTRAYLAEWCGSNERSISRNISNLLKKGYIEQVYKSQDCRQVHYRAITPDKLSRVTKCQGAGDKMSGVPVTKCHADNIEDTIEDTIEEEEKHTSSIVDHARTRKEVEDFIQEHCPHIDALGFWNYYEKRGWQIKGQPIEDWRALAAKWEEQMQQDMNETISSSEMIKLFGDYKRKFGVSVPPEHLGHYMQIRLAIATETPLGENRNGTV